MKIRSDRQLDQLTDSRLRAATGTKASRAEFGARLRACFETLQVTLAVVQIPLGDADAKLCQCLNGWRSAAMLQLKFCRERYKDTLRYTACTRVSERARGARVGLLQSDGCLPVRATGVRTPPLQLHVLMLARARGGARVETGDGAQ